MRKRDGEHGTVHSEKIAPREVAVTTKSQYGTFLAACLLLGAGLSPIRAQDGDGRSAADAPWPNIVLIVADDLGYGDLGAYGQQQIRTPHLDRMAKEGLRFTQFYSGSTVCAPSRSVLVTGQRTGRTPIQGNMPVKPTGQKPLPDTTVTVAEMLRDSGYRTGMSGKWGLGGSGSESAPHRQGFDLGGTSVASDVGPARTGMESPGPRKDVPEMVRNRWWTEATLETGGNGTSTLDAFRGKYRVVAEKRNRSGSARLTLMDGGHLRRDYDRLIRLRIDNARAILHPHHWDLPRVRFAGPAVHISTLPPMGKLLFSLQAASRLLPLTSALDPRAWAALVELLRLKGEWEQAVMLGTSTSWESPVACTFCGSGRVPKPLRNGSWWWDRA